MIQNDKSWYLSPDLRNVENMPVEPQKHHFNYAYTSFLFRKSIVLLLQNSFMALLSSFFTKVSIC